jgi:hypothetical protein
VCSLILEKGAELEEDLWHKLLILSLNYDLVVYPQLAYKAGINLNNFNDETKISLHKAVCCQTINILKFYQDTYDRSALIQMVK